MRRIPDQVGYLSVNESLTAEILRSVRVLIHSGNGVCTLSNMSWKISLMLLQFLDGHTEMIANRRGPLCLAITVFQLQSRGYPSSNLIINTRYVRRIPFESLRVIVPSKSLKTMTFVCDAIKGMDVDSDSDQGESVFQLCKTSTVQLTFFKRSNQMGPTCNYVARGRLTSVSRRLKSSCV